MSVHDRINAFIIQTLKSQEDVNIIRKLIYQNDQLIDDLITLKIDDPPQYNMFIEEIGDLVPRGKTATTKTLVSIIDAKQKQKLKTKFSDFTDVDITSLPMKNGQIIPTVDALSKIISGAKNIRFVYDKMSGGAYFTEIDWHPSEDDLLLIPIMGTDNSRKYHKYTGSDINQTGLQQAMNRGAFTNEVAFSKLDPSMEFAARSNPVDFGIEWITSCQPHRDAIDRLSGDNNFLVKYFKMKKGKWADACARILILSVVTRLMEPGWPLRYYFSLESEQNIGKSKFCRMLVPEHWYVSEGINIQENVVEFYRSTYDKVVIELAELGGTDKASVNLFKRIITEVSCNFRDVYKRSFIAHKKRSITIVTTNEHTYLRDPTGATRCIPIKSTLLENEFVDWEGIEKEIVPIYAQAFHLYLQGERPYLTREELEIQKQETDKRDMTYDTPEYDIIEHYFGRETDGEKLHFEEAKHDGICLDQIYDFMFQTYETPKHVAMLKKRQLGTALNKYGFTVHSNKAIWNAEYKKPVKMWYWPNSNRD